MPPVRRPVTQGGKGQTDKVLKAPSAKATPGKSPTSQKSKPVKSAKGQKNGTIPASIKETPETRRAAEVIQKYARSRLARAHVKGIRQKQAVEKAMQEEMETLRQQAYMAEVAYERKQEQKRRKKAEEEAKRRREEVRIRTALLEAAFDDDLDDLQRLLQESSQYSDEAVWFLHPAAVTATEAAAGGALTVCKYLLEQGCNPNTQGEFDRSPLWRAAFLGKHDVVICLLAAGADPRIANESGELPIHVGSETVKEVLEPWDISVTEELIEKWRQAQEEKMVQAVEAQTQRIKSAEELLDEKQQEHEAAQRTLRAARCDLEKRIHEHDTCVEERKPENLIDVSLQMVKEQEQAVEATVSVAKAAMEEWTEAKQALREQQASSTTPEADALPGEAIKIKELEDVVLQRHQKPGCALPPQGALVIDSSKRASVFFRYIDANYVNALSPLDMDKERLRRSVLGALRYGKPFVLDMLEVDVWSTMEDQLNAVSPGLLHLLISGEIASEANYRKLVTAGDGHEYDLGQFREDRLALFRFIVTTSLKFPDESLVRAVQVYRVKADA